MNVLPKRILAGKSNICIKKVNGKKICFSCKRIPNNIYSSDGRALLSLKEWIFFIRLFSVNTIILICAIAIIPFAISQIVEVFQGFDQLKIHEGVVQEKIIAIDSSRRIKRRIIKLKLSNDTTVYISSKYVDGINTLIQLNDSVQIYTKDISSRFGNLWLIKEVMGGPPETEMKSFI